VITFGLDKITLMKMSDLENRIKELELELSNLKSGAIPTKKETKLATNNTTEDSNVKFLTLANYIPAHIAYVNIETLQYEYVNDLFEKSFGIPREKIIGSHIKDIIGEENYKFALKYINEVKSGKSVSYENTFNLTSGKRWIQVNYSPVFDANSKAIGIALVSYDITEHKQAAKALLESEERFQLLFNKAPLGYQSLDIDGIFIEVNQQWLDTLGYTRDEVIGKWFGDFLSPAYQDGFHKRFPIFKAQGHIHSEFEMVQKNGNKLFIAFEGRIGYDNNGEFKQTHCILQDITERKVLEENLRNNESYLKETQAIANLGTYTMDVKSGKWISSEILDKIFGIDTNYDKSVEGWASLTHPEWKKIMTDYFINEVIGNKTKFDKEYKIIRNSDKVERWVHGIGNLKFDENDQPITMIGTIQDITERKQTELAIIIAKEKAEESDRLKSAFLANMSHEIRTPMNGILGFTELLKEASLSSDDKQDFIQTIQISGERMLNTINNIVDISKIESGLVNVSIEETNINNKIEFTYKFFKPEAERKGLQFTFKNGLPTNDAVIRTDNEKVYGVLTNLIKNAIKFTYDGSIEFGYEKKGAFLEFYIKDTGVGIPKNQKEFIFERFRQGSTDFNRLYEGSGLGLSISKSYIEMLGGKIWVESEEGKGSIFYFTIPYQSAEEIKTEIKNVDSAELKEVQMKNLKILIVEDDEVSYLLLKRTIQKIGKEVLHAITGVEAIEACRSNPDLDLILMDIRMPIMDGCEATRQIRQFNKDVIIIAQTAYAFAGDSEIAIEAGCNDYISKPINMTLLFELIKKHCNS